MRFHGLRKLFGELFAYVNATKLKKERKTELLLKNS